MLLPACNRVLQGVRGLIRHFGNLDDTTKLDIVRWGLIGSAVLGFVAVLGLVGIGIGELIKG